MNANLKSRIIKSLVIMSLTASSLYSGETYYVSKTGDDSSTTGNIDNPYSTVRKGVSKITDPGDTLIIREGKYRERHQIYNFNYSGTDADPITVKAYPGEKVVISALYETSGASQWEQVNNSNIYRFKGDIPQGTGYNKVYNLSQNGKPLRLKADYK